MLSLEVPTVLIFLLAFTCATETGRGFVQMLNYIRLHFIGKTTTCSCGTCDFKIGSVSTQSIRHFYNNLSNTYTSQVNPNYTLFQILQLNLIGKTGKNRFPTVSVFLRIPYPGPTQCGVEPGKTPKPIDPKPQKRKN